MNVAAIKSRRESTIHARDRRLSVWIWLKQNLFASWKQTLFTLVVGWIVFEAILALFRWAVLNAVFIGTPETCKNIQGACWAFVADNIGLFLVGTYPYSERWRPYLWLALFFIMALGLFIRSLRRWRPYQIAWIGVVVVLFFLLPGSDRIGLSKVETDMWGGLLLTVLLSVTGIIFAFPVGILLALGRRSETMPGVRVLCTCYIEIIRGLPLVSLLILSSVLLPLFLPSGVHVNNLVRAQAAIVAFQAGYLAEVVRGGLQAVPRGQEAAASALGLSWADSMFFVILPQALRLAIPSLVNQFIITLKDTSLVVVIGMFDLIGISELVMRNLEWFGKTFEAYAFIAVIFWTACFTISRVSLRLEQQLGNRIA